jgi:hypothetical protein
VIIFITISDFFYAIGTSFGESEDGTSQCSIQHALTNIFPLCSVFWTCVIAFSIIEVVTPKWRHKATDNTSLLCHLWCWIFPIIISFLPLSTNAIGCIDSDRCWCFVKDKAQSPKWSSEFWVIFSFYIWIWSSIIFFIGSIVYTSISIKHYTSDISGLATTHIKRLLAYPAVIVLCWIGSTCYDISVSINGSSTFLSSNLFDVIVTALSCLQGFFTFVVFIVLYWDCLTFDWSERFSNIQLTTSISNRTSSKQLNASLIDRNISAAPSVAESLMTVDLSESRSIAATYY